MGDRARVCALLGLAACSGASPAVDSSDAAPTFAASTDSYQAETVPGGGWTFTPTGGATLALGGAAIARGRVAAAVDESREPGDDGVEQSWRFAGAPAGDGDLTVRVPTSGVDFVGADSLCMHFRARGSAAGVCYGAATWIDAAGVRTQVAAAFDGDAIVLTVPGAIVDASRYPAVLDPLVSAELGIDTPVMGPTHFHAVNPAVDWDGTQAVATWFDMRQPGFGVYAGRVSAGGAVLDGGGVPIAYGTQVETTAIAWNGSSHLVAWVTPLGVSMQRLDAALAPVGSTVLIAPPPAHRVSVASDGAGFLIAWQGAPNTIQGVRVDAQGGVLDSSPLTLSNNASVGERVGLAFDGTSYWLAWTTALGTVEVRVGRVRPSDGAALDGAGFLVGTGLTSGPYNADSACTATTCLATWQEGSWGCDDCVEPTPYARAGRFRTSDGAALDGGGFTLEQGRIASPSPASDGTDFVATWTWTGSSYLTTVVRAVHIAASTGAIAEVPALSVGTQGNQHYPRAVGAGAPGSYLAVWQAAGVYTKIYSARIDAAGVVDNPPLLVSAQLGPNSETDPAAARGNNGWLIVWTDDRDGDYDIYAARVANDGTVLDDPALPIATGDLRDTDPTVAWDGTRYLVAWIADRDVTARRVEVDGTVLDPGGLDLPGGVGISGGAASPRAASLGGGWLVAWTDTGAGAAWMYTQALGARIAADGTVLDTTARVITNQDSYWLEDLAAGPTDYIALVHHDDPWSYTDIWERSVAITPAGAVSLPHNLAPYDISSPGTLASDGTGLLALVSDATNDAYDLRGIRMAGDGTAIGAPFDAIVGPGSSAFPAIAYDGTAYFAAWADSRYGIAGARVAVDGTVADPMGIVISPQDFEFPVDVAGDGTGRWLVAYKRVVEPIARVHFRIVDVVDLDLPISSACVTGADCQSGFCADGVCCNEECNEGCRACNVAGQQGTCTVVAVPVRGNRPTCYGYPPVCEGSCDGVHADCIMPDATIECRAATCNNDWVNPAAYCNGAGSCLGTPSFECDPDWSCSGDECVPDVPIDAAVPDAEPPPDAAVPPPDAEPPPPDAAPLPPDAATTPADAATAPADAQPPPVETPSGGCGCRSSDPAGTSVLALALLLAFSLRPRRRSSARSAPAARARSRWCRWRRA